ncbi:type II toxin-antitoxin system VapC family toxin [Candidatus Roizmanbacteria bacterium]|nr:type II toxin-antitoxin system VapC family toxin [Candidatus Roizmanbacteria bacterium]
MKYLLDTQIFLWALDKDSNLKQLVRRIIINPNIIIYISLVSIWEMSIKRKIGKLDLKYKLRTYVDKSGFDLLNINLDHIITLDKLPLHHRDPFDRLLVAQAKTEKLTLITADPKMKKYDVKLLI